MTEAQMLARMIDDDDLLLRWGRIEYGDVRGDLGQQALLDMKRADLRRLLQAVREVPD